ncbi:MAG: hypothetical protein LBS39_02195 [Campylobacteraceae bacterium]|jgi:hypothetical protein|nr:hypothetical protein [Campylobacteraceae bacterium]
MFPTLNTGIPRSVTGNFISGALTAGILAASISYSTHKSDKKTALKKSIKIAIQGGAATARAIAATNYIGQGRYLNAALSLGAGIGSLYLIEKIALLKENR